MEAARKTLQICKYFKNMQEYCSYTVKKFQLLQERSASIQKAAGVSSAPWTGRSPIQKRQQKSECNCTKESEDMQELLQQIVGTVHKVSLTAAGRICNHTKTCTGKQYAIE
jgi:hypothetical protein